MKIGWKRLLVLASAMVFLGVNIKGLADEATAESRRFSVLSVDGSEAYVVRGGVREVKATAGMPLGQGSSVRTGSQTSLYFEADDDKTIKLDSNTQVEITKSSSKKLRMTLKSGEMFFNVDRPLSEGEELTFHAAQTSMSIRGTGGVLGFTEEGIDLYLIEGKVDWKIGNEVVSVQAGQMASLAKVDNEPLAANQMDSAYELQETKPFTWTDLGALGLEAALEQRANLDLSAIGLNTAEDFALAEQRAVTLRAAQDVREERAEEHMEEQLEAAAASMEAELEDDDDDDSPVRSTTAAEETTEPGTEEPTEPSTEETTEPSTEPPTEPSTEETTTGYTSVEIISSTYDSSYGMVYWDDSSNNYREATSSDDETVKRYYGAGKELVLISTP